MTIVSQDRLGGNQKVGATSEPLTTLDLYGGPVSRSCGQARRSTVQPSHSAGRETKGLSRKGLDAPQRDEAFTSLDTDARSCKSALVSLLRQAEYGDLADRVQQCCSEFRALACPNSHVFDPVPTSRCRYRLCPDCARERQKRAFARVYPALLELKREFPSDRPVLITLTIKSSHDTLATIVRHFKRWFVKLRRSKAWKDHIRGAVAGFEITYNHRHGWHFHTHILAFRKEWWSQDELARAWARATGDYGQIVDIRAVKDLAGGVCEVLKYAFKPADLARWGPDQVSQFNALGRTKLGECYGELRGIVIKSNDDLPAEDEKIEVIEGGPCPECGEPLSIVRISRASLLEFRRLTHPKFDTS